MFNEVITLKSEEHYFEQNVPKTRTISKTVFARAKSIGYREFYQASAAGIKPEITFVISDYLDYENQTVVEYKSQIYDVIRTYITKENSVELTCQRRIADVV